jgi:putative ABC transport system permease protein
VVSTGRTVGGIVVTAVGVLAVAAATTGSGRVGLAVLGALLTLIGVVVLGPVVARPAAATLGSPIAKLRGVVGGLSRQNALRNPRRTAATASALMVGVSVVALFTVVGASLKASATEGVDRSLTADVVVDTEGFGGQSGSGGFSPQLATDIASVPGVDVASGVSNGNARIGGDLHEVTVVEPASVGAVIDLDVVAGSIGAVRSDSVAVAKDEADAHHWTIGTSLPVVYPDGTTDRLAITALYDHTDLTGNYLVDASTWMTHTAQPIDSQILLRVRPGADLAATKTAVAGLARPYGNARVQDRAEYARTAAEGVNTILGLVYVMLVLAIVIALMGIANTLSLSIHERTRELGLLRAVGLTRRQTRSTIRWESVIISVFGTIGGVALGTFLGWTFVQAASTDAIGTFAVPPAPLAIFLVVGALAGVVAGIRPARRAARLDVLQAIAAE